MRHQLIKAIAAANSAQDAAEEARAFIQEAERLNEARAVALGRTALAHAEEKAQAAAAKIDACLAAPLFTA